MRTKYTSHHHQVLPRLLPKSSGICYVFFYRTDPLGMPIILTLNGVVINTIDRYSIDPDCKSCFSRKCKLKHFFLNISFVYELYLTSKCTCVISKCHMVSVLKWGSTTYNCLTVYMFLFRSSTEFPK